jgi:hypothetical protein
VTAHESGSAMGDKKARRGRVGIAFGRAASIGSKI